MQVFPGRHSLAGIMEQLQDGRLRARAEQTAPENQLDQPDSGSLFRLLLEVEAELRKLAREDIRALRDRVPILSRTKDLEKAHGSERLSRYIVVAFKKLSRSSPPG